MMSTNFWMCLEQEELTASLHVSLNNIGGVMRRGFVVSFSMGELDYLIIV